MKTVVSFGGGVQSTALAILYLEGRLPRPDLFMFSDTGDEPHFVYSHVEKWKAIIEAEGMEFMIVRHPEAPLSQHVLSRIESDRKGISYPPLYVERQQEHRTGRMPLWRGCTKTFKSRMLDKMTKEWYGKKELRGWKGDPVITKVLGISYDEMQRMRTSQVNWYEFSYPLIDLKITRADCHAIIKRAGYPEAPRSACTFCPFHNDEHWRWMRDNHPDVFEEAAVFDDKLRELWHDKGGYGGLKSMPTVHKSGRPLREAPIDDEQTDLFNPFDQECAGICGV